MLKSLIRIIKTCVFCFAVCLICSVIFEFVDFSHSRFVQELLIGSACSFIVVVVSTLAQYKIELKKAYSDYISATSDLIFFLVCSSDESFFLNGKRTERLFAQVETAFERFRKAELSVTFLTKRRTDKQITMNEELNRLQLQFLKYQLSSHEEAIRSVSDKDSIARAIDTYLKVWPECYERDHIAMLKEWLVEEIDEDTPHEHL